MKTVKTSKSRAAKTPARTAAVKAPATDRLSTRSVRPATDKPAAAAAAPRRELTSDLIAARAYIIWEQQGRPPGNDVANWLLAENQLKQEIQSFTA